MPGVEILNTTIHYKYALPTWAIVTMVAIIVIPAIMTLIGKINSNDCLYVLGFVCLVIGAVIAALIGMSAPKPTDEIDYIEHEVLVDDSVSFSEFNEKYEIVNQKGKIYVVREKGND